MVKRLRIIYVILSVLILAPTCIGSHVNAMPNPTQTPRSVQFQTKDVLPSVRLYGWVRDQAGSPVPSGIKVIDKQYEELGNVPTLGDGYYELTIPRREILSVSVNPFVINPQDYTEIEEGGRVSRYFQLTKTIIPSGDTVEVDFDLPPAAALLTIAYSPQGGKMLMGEFNSQVSPPWYSSVYGIFPMSIGTVPEGASIGQFYGVWHADKEWNQWEPYFAVPPNEPVYLTMLWPVPSMGTIWLRADNERQGYNLEDGEIQRLNLIYEFAKTEYLRAVEMKQNCENEGINFSSGTDDLLNQANDYLNQARQEEDDKNQSLLSYTVLEYSIRAKEKMTLEAADKGEEDRKKMVVITVQDNKGEPVPGAKMTYKQTSMDFVRGYGIQDVSEPLSPM